MMKLEGEKWRPGSSLGNQILWANMITLPSFTPSARILIITKYRLLLKLKAQRAQLVEVAAVLYEWLKMEKETRDALSVCDAFSTLWSSYDISRGHMISFTMSHDLIFGNGIKPEQTDLPLV
jgi:hypothetical protein